MDLMFISPLIGDGDVLDVLQSHGRGRPSPFGVLTCSKAGHSAYLEKQHIGLLPMPATRVWSLASPLKRSEYLAAGLLVYGVDHSGHRIDGASDAWFKLSPQEDFHEDAREWMEELSTLSEKTLQERSDSARSHAEAHFLPERTLLKHLKKSFTLPAWNNNNRSTGVESLQVGREH